jgi:hypothetical protein
MLSARIAVSAVELATAVKDVVLPQVGEMGQPAVRALVVIVHAGQEVQVRKSVEILVRVVMDLQVLRVKVGLVEIVTHAGGRVALEIVIVVGMGRALSASGWRFRKMSKWSLNRRTSRLKPWPLTFAVLAMHSACLMLPAWCWQKGTVFMRASLAPLSVRPGFLPPTMEGFS